MASYKKNKTKKTLYFSSWCVWPSTFLEENKPAPLIGRSHHLTLGVRLQLSASMSYVESQRLTYFVFFTDYRYKREQAEDIKDGLSSFLRISLTS